MVWYRVRASRILHKVFKGINPQRAWNPLLQTITNVYHVNFKDFIDTIALSSISFFFTTHQKEKVFRLSNKAEIKEKIKVFNLIYNIGKLLN